MSPARKLAVGVAVAAVAILATAAPASAHDELISSSPAADERLAAPPETVTMTFSGTLLTLDDSMTGAVVLIVDEDGRDWATDDVDVFGDTVTVDIAPGMPEAGYQVRWQVVSEDGHPITGVIPFTIGDAKPMSTEGSDGGSATVQEADDQAAPEMSGGLRALLIGGGGALIAVALFALYRFLRRPRTAPAPLQDGESAE